MKTQLVGTRRTPGKLSSSFVVKLLAIVNVMLFITIATLAYDRYRQGQHTDRHSFVQAGVIFPRTAIRDDRYWSMAEANPYDLLVNVFLSDSSFAGFENHVDEFKDAFKELEGGQLLLVIGERALDLPSARSGIGRNTDLFVLSHCDESTWRTLGLRSEGVVIVNGRTGRVLESFPYILNSFVLRDELKRLLRINHS